MYLECFSLPIEEEESLIERKMKENGGRFGYIDNIYPCGIFSKKELYEINFRKVTIFYGGNGSGKSTLLNLIAEKLGLQRVSPFNTAEMFRLYTEHCDYRPGYDEDGSYLRIPEESRIITSDDVFDYMLTVRTNNEDIKENKEIAKEKWAELKFGETIRFSGLEDYEANRLQLLARSKSVSRRAFIRRTAGEEVKLNSNGETALRYFETKLQPDTLYCLDEPENSMSPAMQLELLDILNEYVRLYHCQFIIATHSPFLLAMEGARIYDLDARPAAVRNWWELENTKTYYRFFKKYKDLFEEERS